MSNKVIGIIGGRGAMGKYFADFFESNGYEVIISDKKTSLTNKQLAKKADVVIISVPIDKTEKVIKEIAPLIKKSGLLMDLTSLKEFPMKAMKATKASHLGCHPLFGPSNPIQGQLVIMCPGKGSKWFDWLKNLFEKNKVIVKTLTTKKHDTLMSYVQALTHFSDIALADTLRKSGIPIKEMVTYQSPVYRLELDMMGRILNQDPNLYANIQIDNPLSKKVMQDFIESCKKLTEIVTKKDNKSFVKYFNSASKYLGSFTEQAMIESDRLIKEMLGSGMPSAEPPKDLVKKYDLAVLGPRDTYSDIAARKFKPKARIWYTSSINEIFALVRDGKIKYGFVPIENSLTGSVREALDELFEEDVWIEQMTSLPIHLALIGIRSINLKDIKTVYSHPQPFLQSRQFIKKNLPNAVCLPVASTAAALSRVLKEQDPYVVSIGSETVVKKYGLKIIKKSIQDNENNRTYFAVIRKSSKTKDQKSNGKKTSIAFTFKKDAPGSLFSVLQNFSDFKINLTKIESRPNPKVHGDYVFYIDFEGGLQNSNIQKALNKVKGKVEKLKVLGSY
ncbi:prephenate dehydratase [Patescibacteria group bacterium]|nr:prephenate dehydratase [Patescibacteria group bacterium]